MATKYHCQRCGREIIFDNIQAELELQQTNNHSAQEQSAALGESYIDVSKPSSSTHNTTSATPVKSTSGQSSQNGSESTNGTNSEAVHLSQHQAIQGTLQRVSDDLGVDFPLCRDCTQRLRVQLSDELTEVQDEIEKFEVALAQLNANQTSEASTPQENNENQNANEKQLQEEIKRVEEEINSLQKKLGKEKSRFAEVVQQVQDVRQMETAYWHAYNDFNTDLMLHLEDRDGLLQKIERTEAQLDVLKRTNVYNDMFYIWVSEDNDHGTISGLRLTLQGTKSSCWDELNSGMGQVVLLLHSLVQRLGSPDLTFSLKSGWLIPLGAQSKISDTNGNTYPLYGPPAWLSQQYDRGLLLLVECLKEVADFLAQATSKSNASGERIYKELPYKIENGHIGSYSIKYTYSPKWSKALLFMLVDLKQCVLWMTDLMEIQTIYAPHQQA